LARALCVCSCVAKCRRRAWFSTMAIVQLSPAAASPLFESTAGGHFLSRLARL
jgi:hypothetical protein